MVFDAILKSYNSKVFQIGEHAKPGEAKQPTWRVEQTMGFSLRIIATIITTVCLSPPAAPTDIKTSATPPA